MQTVYDYIRQEEVDYKTKRVPVADGYEWSMPEHIRKCILYRDSKFTQGADDGSRPFKNIVRRIRNLQRYATGFDVKDILPYITNSSKHYLSFIARKFHTKWARKNKIDSYIDAKVESYVDFGGALSKHVNKIAPEIVQLQTIAFCDQTDILSGPICIKHNYSPAQLRDFDKNWENIEEVIKLARDSKADTSLSGTNERIVKTPGKYIEVYELDGMFPKAWLMDKPEQKDWDIFTPQFHVVTFYTDTQQKEQGIRLYRGPGDPKKYKFIARDPIFGRALGMSAIEELFEAQVWTNYNMIRIQGMIDTASKIIFQTEDASMATQNKWNDLENGQFVKGKAERLDNAPANFTVFDKMVAAWDQHAQDIGSAGDAILGERPTAGTPFALQQLNAQQQQNLHEYRRGQIATQLEEEYHDWFLPDLVKDLNNEQEFMEELSLDELQYVAGSVADYETSRKVKEAVIKGDVDFLNPDAIGQFKEQVRAQFMKGGNKRFFKLLKNEYKRIPIDVEVNIAGKQKDLAGMTDKLVNVFKMVIANPAALQIPAMAKTFNNILEYSGIDQVDFSPDQLQPPQSQGAGPKISESINFKDLPPDGQQQMAAQAGIKIAPPSPLSPAPAEETELAAA